jgi:uncharacterized protein GlcG (DUF336 family)
MHSEETNSERRSLLTGLVSLGGVVAGGVLSVAGAKAAEAQQQFPFNRRGPLSKAQLDRIIDAAVASANKTESPLRSIDGKPRTTKMHIAVVDRSGKVLRFESMDDAWEGSKDIAIAKARTAAFFSSDENALTSRIIGVLSQAHAPDGSGGAGPLWGIGDSNQIGITGGPETRNGLITFPGGVPLYHNGKLVGGIGVSGDGVDQDETVAFAGAAGFPPGKDVAKLGFD